MNYQDREGRDPRTYGAAPDQPDLREAPLDGIDSFVSEATIVGTPFKAEGPDPLWEFPEEALLPAGSAASVASGGQRSPVSSPARTFPLVASVAAAIVVTAVAGVWWTGSLQQISRAVANRFAAPPDMPRAASAATTPEPVIPSVEVRPLREEPLATVAVPTFAREGADPLTKNVMGSDPSREKPVALSAAAAQQPTSRVPATAMARGTSGAGAQPLRGFTTQPTAAPLATPPVVASTPLNVASDVSNVAPRSVPAEPTMAAVETSPVTAPPVAPEAVATVPGRTEQTGIQQVLGQYRSAYGRLDADAAQTVWPSVDARALARAFDSLSSQELAFDSCKVDIAGETATAQCRGSATYTPKIGSREPKLEERQWVFQLRKAPDGWKIQSAHTRR